MGNYIITPAIEDLPEQLYDPDMNGAETFPAGSLVAIPLAADPQQPHRCWANGSRAVRKVQEEARVREQRENVVSLEEREQD